MRQKALLSLFVLTAAVVASSALGQTPLSGPYFGYSPAGDQGTPPTDPNNQYILTGDTQFGWQLNTWPCDININGFNLTQDTGGGNYQNISGALTGATGTYNLASGGNAGPAVLSGTTPNTFAGSYNIVTGTNLLELNKTAGVAAISGPVYLNSGTIQWEASNQMASAPAITLQGGTTLDFNGNSEILGTLTVAGPTNANLLLGGAGTVHFNNSSALPWGGDLIVQGWNGTATGGGANELIFGGNASGLTSGQLSQIYFSNPSGFAGGNFTALLLGTGELVPGSPVAPPAVSWSGETDNPMTTFGGGTLVRLSGDGTFGWQTGICTVAVDLNGNNLTFNNGNGNTLKQQGQISGIGTVTFQGRGDWTWEGWGDNHVGGTTANTYVGTTTVTSGWLQLEKPAGTTAIPGNIQIGVGDSFAGVILANSDQSALGRGYIAVGNGTRGNR